jgi:hypothetical protein
LARLSKKVDATETMIERTEERIALRPNQLAGDVVYGTGEMLGYPSGPPSECGGNAC